MITEDTLKLMIPVQAVIIFKRDSDDFYLQTHDIVDNKYTEGKPFNREQLKELSLALSSKGMQMTELRGLLPDKILYYQPSIVGNKFIWYVPKAKQALNFKTNLKLKSGNYQVPSMIFAVDDRSLTVFAYKGSGKPNADTKLFHVPLFNINAAGLVCMGTTSETSKKTYLEDEMNRHERRFFGSNFTHTPNKVAKGFTMRKVWSMKTANRFPEASLAAANHTNLKSFVNSFIKGKGDQSW